MNYDMQLVKAMIEVNNLLETLEQNQFALGITMYLVCSKYNLVMIPLRDEIGCLEIMLAGMGEEKGILFSSRENFGTIIGVRPVSEDVCKKRAS